MTSNSDETLFFSCSILVNQCSGSCNDINGFWDKLCLAELLLKS